jgi:hypothetical protein
MNVVHINNIGGVAWDLRTAQREMGDSSVVIAKSKYSLNPPDVDLRLDGILGFNLELFLYRRKWLHEADVIHIHGGIRRTHFVYGMIKKMSHARLVLHFHGSETRLGYGMHHMDLADLKLVATPDLKKWHEDAIWLPNPVEAALFEMPKPSRRSVGPLRIGHFPNDPSLKGTARIKQALKPFVDSNKVDLIVRERMGHAELLDEISKVDVLIDQLTDFSSYGKTSLEAMVLGVPAISSYDESLFPPGCMVIRASTEGELAQRVEELCRKGITEDLRRRSIAYVTEHHHPMKVARALREYYQSVL